MAGPLFYNQGDQDIYNSGTKFLPQEKYRLNKFTAPTAQIQPVPTSSGITNTNAFNNGGSGFSVYNPDPSSIVNRNYNPKPNYDAYYEDTFGANAKDPLSNFTMTGDPNKFEEFGDPTGATYADPSKLQGFASALTNFIPGKGIAQFLGSYAPPNRRSIFENQLSGQGIMVDNIGRIVQGQGDYNTAGNIMAGYNASKVDADTFQKRRDMINEKMKDPVQKEAKLKALDEAEKRMLDTATTQTNKIYDFEEEEKNKKKSNNFLARIFKRTKINRATKNNQDNTTTDGGTKTKVTKTTNDGGDKTNVNKGKGTTETAKGGVGTAAYGQSFHHSKKDGGRAGYFFGGRVNYKQGGRVSFKNGGLASIL